MEMKVKRCLGKVCKIKEIKKKVKRAVGGGGWGENEETFRKFCFAAL